MSPRRPLVLAVLSSLLACAPASDGVDAGGPSDAGPPDAGEAIVDAGVPCEPIAYGPAFPTSAFVEGTEPAWDDPTKARVADGDEATVTTGLEGVQMLRLTGFGATIPIGATVTGVTIRVAGRAASGAQDVRVTGRAGYRGNVSTEAYTDVVTFGATSAPIDAFGPGERWNGQLSRALVVIETFFIDLGFSTDGDAATLAIDAVSVRFDYTTAEGAQQTDFLVATTSEQVSLARPWQDVSKILAIDDEEAVVAAMVDYERTARLRATGFGIEIPEEAEIKGIEVAVTRRSLANEIQDFEVRLSDATGVVGADRFVEEPWAAVSTTALRGGADDLWNHAWTPALVNDPAFGVSLRAHFPSVSGNDHARVDAISVTVWACP